MMTKLTLRLDSELIEKAKKWSKRRNLSLSQVVANYLSYLDQLESHPESKDLSAWAKTLLGSVKASRDLDTKALRDKYTDHLIDKYQ